jgi:serine/threonine protein kinase/WD40 repeat protein
MSDDERNQRLIELFAQGVELDADGRRAMVERVCEEDPELGAELGALLQVEARGLGGFLEGAAIEPPTDLVPVMDGAEEKAPRPPRIDGFEELSLVGEGGMGVVYRAEQRQPVRRTVAIKVIRSGMDSRTVLQRFEVERQALARMSHAYIASVHDAGSDQEGRPFLVMEFVDGSSVTEFCRAEKLSLEERVELCAKICEAVEHAHRRGVLHRDLKPSNVLVMRQDGAAIPKIIDFGIAKSILGDLSEQTLLTQQGAFLGTPEYMGPEQFDLDASKIDTRTDVYALGVIAYEMITGVLPFDSERLRTSGLGQMVSILQTEVPPKPSTRLRALTKLNGKGAADAASFASPTRWAQRIKGELDWVVMKALAKDPDRRYGTPGAMADDLRRFLSFEPVMAAPPSGAFRLRRFVRRYRIQVAAGLLLLLSLIAGLTGTLWFLAQSKDNEAVANRRASEAVEAQRLQLGSSIASRAALAIQDDPNAALLLALDAGHYADEYVAADAIYRALPTHDLVGSQNLRDRPTRTLEFLDDGRLLAQTTDNVLWLLDPDTSKVIRRFDGHTYRIVSMDVAPEVGLVLSAALDETVRLWGIEDGVCRAVFDQGERLRYAAFSPDSKWIAALTVGGVVRVYDVESLGLVNEYVPEDAPWSSFDFHPTEKRLLLHTLDGSGEVRSLGDGELVSRVSALAGEAPAKVSTARFSPSGEHIVRTFGPITIEYRTQVLALDGEVLRDLHDCRLMKGPLCEPQMALLHGQIIYLSLETGDTVGELDSEPLTSLLGVAPDGQRFLAVDEQRDIGLFNLSTGAKIRKIAGTSEKTWVKARAAFHPDGRRFAASGPRARIWSLEPEYAPLDVFGEEWAYRFENRATMAYGSEGAMVIVHAPEPGGGDSWNLWSIDERRILRTLRPEGINFLYLSQDGERLLGKAGRPAEKPIRCVAFDLEGNQLGEFDEPMEGTRRWIDPDGLTIATLGKAEPSGMRLQIMDFATGALVLDRKLSDTYFGYASFPQYGYAAVHKFTGVSEIFDVASGTIVCSIQNPSGAMGFHAAIDPAARRVLIGQSNKVARAYDLDGDFTEPTGEYTHLVYSDRVRAGFIPHTDLAWSSCSNEVHLYHAATCRPFAILRLDAIVIDVVPHPDGSEFLTLTESGRCQRWPTNPLTVAREKAVEGMNEATLKVYGIGTPEERRRRDHERLLASPSPGGMMKIGEAALIDGDLDLAIEYFRRAAGFGPLGRDGVGFYKRRLALLCRRIARDGAVQGAAPDDVAEAAEVIEDCLLLKVPIEALRKIPSFELLEAESTIRAILGI